MGGPRMMRVDPALPSEEIVEAAAEALRQGGILALPSDTIYGLSCNAYEESAVLKISMIKGHLGQRPFVVLFDGSDKWLERLAPKRSHEADRLRKAHWPGPLTMIMPAGPGAPQTVVSETGGIALRHPDHALSAAILRAFGGPIVSTSANLIGEKPLADASAIADTFGAHLDLVLDAGRQLDNLASTIIDVTGSETRLLRQGTVTLK